MMLKWFLALLGITALLIWGASLNFHEPRDLAFSTACVAAAMQTRHPADASWPHLSEAVVIPLGADRWEVRSSVASPNGWGLRTEKAFVARVYVPAGARGNGDCQVESLQFSP
jgi:hypothetical protein